MAEANPDAVRRAFAELTGLFEDAALIASDGQGVQSRNGGRRDFKRISKKMDRIHQRLIFLERRLG